MEKVEKFITVFATTNNFENARQIANIIVSEKLAACCTIVPNVFSIYIWKGEINQDMEYLLIIKTLSDKANELEKRILQMHSYEIPEIFSISMEAASINYLNWINSSLKENEE